MVASLPAAFGFDQPAVEGRPTAPEGNGRAPHVGGAATYLWRGARAAWLLPRPVRACGRRACAGSPTRGGRRSSATARAVRDLGVAEPFGHESEHLDLSCSQSGRIRLCRPSRPPREPAGTALAQLSRHDGGCGLRPERLETGQRPSLRLRMVRVRERQRCLVRAAEGRPDPSCTLGVAGELERVRLGYLHVEPIPGAGAAPPNGERPCGPTGTAANCG